MEQPDRKKAAYHEAGHAVAAHILFGRAFEAVSIDSGRSLSESFREQAGDWFESGSPIDARVRQRIEEETMRIFSGPLAEQRGLGMTEPDPSYDDHNAVKRLAMIATEGDEDEAKAYAEWLSLRALRLMNRYDVWPAVRSLAERLLEEGTLSYDQARDVIERSRSEMHFRDIQDHPVLRPPGER